MDKVERIQEKISDLSVRLSDIKDHLVGTAVQAVNAFKEKGRSEMCRVVQKGISGVKSALADYREHLTGVMLDCQKTANQICKACSRLSAAEKAAAMDMNRLMSFPMRRLSESEKKWLKAKMKDNCQEVADMAKEVYNICFPHAERNAMKKQLIINILSFKVHTEVYDRYGDMEMADCLFTIDRKSRTLTMTDFHADSGEQSVVLDGGKMAKLLRYIVHILEIFMWEQDYCLNPDGDDFFTDILLKEGIYVDDLGEKGEAMPEEPEGRPSWQVHIEYSNHTVQDISGFDDYLPERPEELYLSFMEYFESDYEIL